MLEQDESQFNAGPRPALKVAVSGTPAPDTPRKNQLLAALPLEDYARLLPHLAPVSLRTGLAIHRAGDRESFLYFPTSGIIARSYVSADGDSSELAITGSEGVVGVASFLGGTSTLSRAEVMCAGSAYRLRADVLQDEFDHACAVRNLLLRYTEALIAQTAQLAVCNRHHSVKQQLCRWILSYLDRMHSSELAMTHELIARIMGIRRESISEAAGKLQKEGLIHYRRGHITVLDRAGVEAEVCECYAVVKREYSRLLDPKNRPHRVV